MPQHTYGWRRDLPDHRDQRLALAAPRVLPSHVDLSAGMPTPYDQGQLGACTGNSIAAAVQYERRRQALPDWVPSRLFIYYEERVREHTVHSDSGAEVRDGFKVISHQGVCPEPLWPYDIARFDHRPSAAAYAAAKKHTAITYARVDQTAQALKTTLATEHPIVFGFSVYSSFESDAVAASGLVPMPQRTESLLGGHCVIAVGYDTARQTFKCWNPWGASWGQGGYFVLPDAYILSPQLAADFWVLTMETND